MKRSRQLYLHEETNQGKIAQLETLAQEYRVYLQQCVDLIVAHRRFDIPRFELTQFFPRAAALNSNIESSCQQHAVGLIKGWAATLYVQKVRGRITHLKQGGIVTDEQARTLYTIGKRLIDRPSALIPREALEVYWKLLLAAGKTPTISNRTGMRLNKNTGNLKQLAKTELVEWWLTVSTLTRYRAINLPVKANPNVKLASALVKGALVRQDKRGRWLVEAMEVEEAPDFKVDPKAPRIGIDVGLNVIASTSDGRLYGADQKPKFNELKAKVDKLRANRQRQGLKTNSKRLDVLEDRLTGFIKTLTGTVANKLVKSYQGYTFVLEDLNLQGCRGSKRFAYRALANALGRKAPCLSVNPAYTSQECPSCGYISKSNRKGTEFNCRSCGRKSHADVIGAINIVRRSYDSSIDCDTKVPVVKADLQRRFSEKRRRPEDRPEVNELASSSRELTVGMKPKRRTRIDLNALPDLGKG
jgi:putative transposase